ncbi:MAG: radical SAM protein [Kiritimatiellae bacterium]|nr:radical SAM protein [Kiritimatiellia bacterium]
MKPLRLPWNGRDVPYAMLDIIRGCNCICKTCYNREVREAKPLDQIERELDIIFTNRRVEFVGILGGEPLLHPDIVEIVRRIKARGVGSVIMTNGILWTEELARQLAEAGLVMAFFHIQTGQVRSDLTNPSSDIEVARLAETKCAIAQDAGIMAAVSTTIRADTPNILSSVMTAFRRNRSANYAFLTLERSMQTIDGGIETFAKTNSLDRCVTELAKMGWRPFAGIGGRFRPDTMRWMVFHAYQRLDGDGQETDFAALPPSLLERTLFAILRLSGRQLPMRTTPSRGAIIMRIILNALSGGPVGNLGFACRVLFRGGRLVTKNVFVEAFPELLADGRIECCEPCLDAVVKNGKLVPACLSDVESANGGKSC